MGTYSYTTKSFQGYNLGDESTKSVNLSDTNLNAVVTFSYSKILGSVTIKYIDKSSLVEIFPSKVIDKLELVSYSYNAISIYGYNVSGDTTKTVMLTSTNPNQVITFNYSKILGEVTIRYIEEGTDIDISEKTIYSNLELGTYKYSAKSIDGYNVDNLEQSVTLTATTPKATIIFSYSEILGNINIKYLDDSSLAEIAPSTTISNIVLGDYTYDAISIDGYEVVDASSISITLTSADPNRTISFKYNKIQVEIPADLNWNEVPYISTYYIKPVVEPDEEVFIDYYITDYYYKEYMEKYNLKEDNWGDDNWIEEVWNSETFTVTVRVEGQEDKLYHNLKARDHQVSLGSFSTEGEQKFSILCTDKYGRNSHELFNFFLVRKPVVWNEYVMTEEDLIKYNIKNTDTYEVKKIIDLSVLASKTSATVKAALIEETNKVIPELKTYVCVIADTTGDGTPDYWWAENQVVYASNYDKKSVLQEATNTRIGLQYLLDDKKSKGYNKMKLLPGIYRIDYQKQIYIPTEFTLDMNGSTLKQNQFTGNKSFMIELNNTFDSHVINGTIEGDYFSHDYANSTSNSEWVNGINIGEEAKYSSFKNSTIKDITGYRASNEIANSRNNNLGYTYISPIEIGNSFKLGHIDRITGVNIQSTNRTTSNFNLICKYKEIGYLSVSVYLGYQGNPCGTWNLACHFYDENKNFIKSIDSYQYRRIGIPKNSRYIRITILNESYPTNLSIQYFIIPTNCSFKKINFENCRSVAMASAAMNNLLFDSCKFTRSSQTLACCAFDAEDGLDMIQDFTFKNLMFYNNIYNDFLTCAGHNLIIQDQTDGHIYILERTRSLVVKECKNVNFTIQGGGKNTIVRHGIYRIYNNTFVSGNLENNFSKNNFALGTLSGKIYISTVNCLTSGSSYLNCNILINKSFLGYIYSIFMNNYNLILDSNFNNIYNISFNGGHKNNYTFIKCNFNDNCLLSDHNNFSTSKFINCNFSNVSIFPNVNAEESDLISF